MNQNGFPLLFVQTTKNANVMKDISSRSQNFYFAHCAYGLFDG